MNNKIPTKFPAKGWRKLCKDEIIEFGDVTDFGDSQISLTESCMFGEKQCVFDRYRRIAKPTTKKTKGKK